MSCSARAWLVPLQGTASGDGGAGLPFTRSGDAAVRGIHPRTIFVDTIWKLTVHAGGLSGDVDGTDGLDPGPTVGMGGVGSHRFGHARAWPKVSTCFRRAASVAPARQLRLTTCGLPGFAVSATAPLARSTGTCVPRPGWDCADRRRACAGGAARYGRCFQPVRRAGHRTSAAALGDDARLGGDDAGSRGVNGDCSTPTAKPCPAGSVVGRSHRHFAAFGRRRR